MPVETRAQKRKKRLLARAAAVEAVEAVEARVAAAGVCDSFAKPTPRRASIAECSMCLAGMWLPRTLACGHDFHAGCLRTWQWHGGMTCPLCRAPLEVRGWRLLSVLDALLVQVAAGQELLVRVARFVQRGSRDE